MKTLLPLLALSAILFGAAAEEYFVSVTGNDGASGKKESEAFRTISRGVRAIGNGDTLTILPGRYFESVEWKLPGKEGGKRTVIRAKYPGSVLIHGDKPAPRFRKIPGYRFVYEADWNEPAFAVNERDTLKILTPSASIRELEFDFGHFVLENGKLYLSTTDGREPDPAHLSVSVLPGNGFVIANAVDFELDGISVTGFYSHEMVKNNPWSASRHGIYLTGARNTTVRRCRAFLNSNGISLGVTPKNTLIEDCVAYANGSKQPLSGGNIIVYGSCENSTIRRCRSSYSLNGNGIRIYGGNIKNGLIEDCDSFGEQYGFMIKGNATDSIIRNSRSEGMIASEQSSGNIFSGANHFLRNDPPLLNRIPKKEWMKRFADPERYDFRPIQDVQIGMPARIEPGMTILLETGNYPCLEIAADNVTVRTRGSGKRAVVRGARITGRNVTLEDLDFRGEVILSGFGGSVRSCEFAAGAHFSGSGLALTHNRFKEAPDVSRAAGFEYANVGAAIRAPGLFPVGPGQSFDAMPEGPYRLHPRRSAGIIGKPAVYALTDTTCDIEWWTDAPDVTSELFWGTTPECREKAGNAFSGGNFHSVTLSGLKPDTRYYFRVHSRSPIREHHSNAELEQLDKAKPRLTIRSETAEFTTAAKPAKPRILHAGKNTEYPVISDALDAARAGDTVMIAGGVYREVLRFRSGGDSGRTVTLRNRPGEQVVLDAGRVFSTLIHLKNKTHVVIDGLTLREVNGDCGVKIDGGHDITLRRCFYDGRSFGYTPRFVYANSVRRLLLDNCVIMRGFSGATFMRCPDLEIRNCVWYNNQCTHLHVHNLPEELFYFHNNLVADVIPMKYGNALIELWHLEALREKDNCFFLRQTPENRLAFSYYRLGDKPVSRKVVYAQLLKDTNHAGSSFFANPAIPAVGQLLSFTENPLTTKRRRTGYSAEALDLQNRMDREEMRMRGNRTYAPFSFADFISENPELLKRDIGLNPQLFKNGAPK